MIKADSDGIAFVEGYQAAVYDKAKVYGHVMARGKDVKEMAEYMQEKGLGSSCLTAINLHNPCCMRPMGYRHRFPTMQGFPTMK